MILPTNPYEQHHPTDYLMWRGFRHGTQSMYALLMEDLSFHQAAAHYRREYALETWLEWLMETYAEEYNVEVNGE